MTTLICRCLLSVTLWAWASLVLADSADSADLADNEPVSFHRQVLPIFRTHCVICHKPAKLKGGLDLTTHAGLLAGGESGPAFQPGQADASLLVELVTGDEPQMPQDGEALLSSEVELIRQWIAQGAIADAPVDNRSERPSEPPTYRALPAVQALAFSPDGTLLAVPGHHEILLHDAHSSTLVARLLGDSPRLESLAFSRDGKLLVASGGAVSDFGEIQIWSVAERRLLRSIKASRDAFYGVSISPDNRLVAVGCADKLVRVFDVANGTEVMRCDNHLDWVFGTAFANDGRQLATISRDKAAKLIDIATGHLIDDINRTRDPLICLARHPAEDLIATGGTDGVVRLFRMMPRGGRLAEGDNKEESFVREFESLGSPVQCVAFGPDGLSIAASAASGEVRVFKTENGQRITQCNAEQGPVYALAFTADGKQFATGGVDGHIRFYDSTTGQSTKELPAVPLP